MTKNLEHYQTDALFLLVGTNPLPNFVAACLLTRPDSTVWLLHSHDPDDGPRGTKRSAEALELALIKRLPGITVRLEAIPSSNNVGIEERVGEILNRNRLEKDIGLNYTGGTKVMAVYVHRAMEEELKKRHERPVFSYLDPRRLALRFDGHGTTIQTVVPVIQNPLLRTQVEINLDELAALHGYERDTSAGEGWADADVTPGLSELCSVLAETHASDAGFKQYREWLFQLSRKKVEKLPDQETFPQLESLRNALDELCGGSGQATPNIVAAKLRPHDKQARLISCVKWFFGVWLEEYGTISLLSVAAKFGLKSRDKNLEYRSSWEDSNISEIDAAAMLGYQLFGISCIASQQKSKTKEHLFEAFVRFRQLGGDEARTGLVCLADAPGMLERELSREWDAEGKLKVFGRQDLVTLATAMKRWFETSLR